MDAPGANWNVNISIRKTPVLEMFKTQQTQQLLTIISNLPRFVHLQFKLVNKKLILCWHFKTKLPVFAIYPVKPKSIRIQLIKIVQLAPSVRTHGNHNVLLPYYFHYFMLAIASQVMNHGDISTAQPQKTVLKKRVLEA